MTFSYNDALVQVDDLLAKAAAERQAAAKYGADAPVGEASLRFAGQFTAEAQVMATVALAMATRGREQLEAGI